jgi:tetratricopeptide (TPR) repeat protein
MVRHRFAAPSFQGPLVVSSDAIGFQASLFSVRLDAVQVVGHVDKGTVVGRGVVHGDGFPSRAARGAQRALDLDPGLAEAHVALGHVRLIHWDWPRAEAEIRRALELDPNSVAAHNALSVYLTAMGRAKEAVDEARRARDLDPLLPLRILSLATMYQLAGEYDRALAEVRKALEMSPDMPSAHVLVGVVYLLQNRSEEALPSLEKARDLTGHPEPLIALAYARSGRRAKALKLISEIADETKEAKHVQPTKIALVYAELGLKDQAFDWLQRAYEEHDAWLVNVKLGKFVDPLRSDPRYLDLLKQMGLPP